MAVCSISLVYMPVRDIQPVVDDIFGETGYSLSSPKLSNIQVFVDIGTGQYTFQKPTWSNNLTVAKVTSA